MSSKFIGGILLVVGTSIGAGMLALPVVTAQLGFWGSLVLLIAAWGVMTSCALLFLEVNLWLPPESNLISMAGATLGKAGQAITWVVYLVLLYSIISAYIAGGGDVLQYLSRLLGFHVAQSYASLFFTVLFGSVVYLGIKSVDYVNRGLMFSKLGALIFLILLILPYISQNNLNGGEIKQIIAPSTLTITAVSFACLMIIPSLRAYFGNDVKTLKKVILIGTTIPLLCYIAWDMVIMGVVPLHGDTGLLSIFNSHNTNSMLLATLATLLNKDMITLISRFFISICMVTSFLSVSLSLSDFLSDGLRVQKKGLFGNGIIILMTFLPPLLLVLFYPNAFLLGLQYAGISVLILMILLPSLMAWVGRYHQHFKSPIYHARINKFVLFLFISIATATLSISGLAGVISLVLIALVLMIGFLVEKTNLKSANNLLD